MFSSWPLLLPEMRGEVMRAYPDTAPEWRCALAMLRRVDKAHWRDATLAHWSLPWVTARSVACILIECGHLQLFVHLFESAAAFLVRYIIGGALDLLRAVGRSGRKDIYNVVYEQVRAHLNKGCRVYVLEGILIGGHMDWFWDMLDEKQLDSVTSRVMVLQAAARYCDLVTFQRVLGRIQCPEHSTARLYTGAAKGGHLETLQWLYNNGYVYTSVRSDAICNAAAAHGDLSMLQWLGEKGFPRDVRFMCFNAAKHGHLAIVQWVLATPGSLNGFIAVDAFEEAARAGHLPVFQWLLTQWPLLETCPRAVAYAMANGHMSILRHADAMGFKPPLYDPIFGNSMEMACKNGHLDAMRWGYDHGILFDEAACRTWAERHHREDMLAYLRHITTEIR